MFFRREVIKTVTWAGEPAKVGMIAPNGPRFTPRKIRALRKTASQSMQTWV